jgi:cobyrinic acid a,c-diamide synthase
VDTANRFYAVGTSIRGHEFHYSGPTEGSQQVETCMKVESGVGVGGTRDGLVYANTLACYTHVHADGVESWASAMVSAATDHAAERRRRSDENSSTDKDKDIDTDGRLEAKAI